MRGEGNWVPDVDETGSKVPAQHKPLGKRPAGLWRTLTRSLAPPNGDNGVCNGEAGFGFQFESGPQWDGRIGKHVHPPTRLYPSALLLPLIFDAVDMEEDLKAALPQAPVKTVRN